MAYVQGRTGGLGGGGFKYFLGVFTPKLGEDEPILTIIFSRGLVQPPTRLVLGRAFFF